MRRPAQGVRLAQGRLGAVEVALQPADVADGVEPVGLRRCGVVGAELGRCSHELQLGPFPGATDGGHLSPVDPADSWEAGEGLAVAVPLRRLDPLTRTAVVRQVAAGADHPAGGDPARER